MSSIDVKEESKTSENGGHEGHDGHEGHEGQEGHATDGKSSGNRFFVSPILPFFVFCISRLIA